MCQYQLSQLMVFQAQVKLAHKRNLAKLINNHKYIGQFKDDKYNVLKNSPHTLETLTSDHWDLNYSREQAAFPIPYLKNNKFWPSVTRIDEAFGDRNLICTCSPIEDYIES